MYAAETGGRELTFAAHPEVFRDNLLLFDMQTKSLWSQLGGGAIDGALRGNRLRALPSVQTTWGHWRTLYPDTEVVISVRPAGRLGSRPPAWPAKATPESSDTRVLRAAQIPASELVLGINLEDAAKAYAISVLAEAKRPLRDQVGGRGVVVHYDEQARAAWATDEAGRLVPTVAVVWSAWRDFHPKTEIYILPAP